MYKNIHLLKKVLKIVGVNSLNDNETKIFNYKLKLDEKRILEELNVHMGDIKIYFDDVFEVDNIDKLIRLIKLMCDKCEIKYDIGRTSASSYFRLRNDEKESGYKLIGDVVFDRTSVINNSQSALLLLLCQTGKRDTSYELLINNVTDINLDLLSSQIDKNKFNFNTLCDDISRVCLVIKCDGKNNIDEIHNCVKKISKFNECGYGINEFSFDKQFIDDDSIYCCFNSNNIKKLRNDKCSFKIEFDDDFNKYDILSIKIITFGLVCYLTKNHNVITFNNSEELINYKNDLKNYDDNKIRTTKVLSDEYANKYKKVVNIKDVKRTCVHDSLQTDEMIKYYKDTNVNMVELENNLMKTSEYFIDVNKQNVDQTLTFNIRSYIMMIMSIKSSKIPRKIVMSINGHLYNYDKDMIILLNQINNVTEGFKLSFYDPLIGNAWININRIDQFSIKFTYDNDNDVNYNLEYFDH
jgi:hypothetical protein